MTAVRPGEGPSADDGGSFARRASRRARAILDRLVETWPELDARVYVVWCASVIAYVASVFCQSMLDQTGGDWSAPLDDAFIHFDYARSAARGRLFEWSGRGGYSSGGTSLTYPLVLAVGWRAGYRDLELMKWAIGVACLSLLVFFIAASRYTKLLGPWAKYLFPPVVLSLGALDWSLFSGMENAFHLGVWGAASLAFDAFERRATSEVDLGLRPAILLGGACAALVVTRPESIVCVAAFAVFAAVRTYKRGIGAAAQATSVVVAMPAGLMGLFACLNRYFTGEWSQAGAIAKLPFYDPYLSTGEKLSAWGSNLKWLVPRLIHHHFSDEDPFRPGERPFGYIIPAIALVPLFVKKLRARAIFLWVQVVLWIVVVSANDQVRWQNERYAMSSVAWLLLLAAMGVAGLASEYGATVRARAWWASRLGVAALSAALYWRHQHPNVRDQIWFFSRACRNIRDQQVEAGRKLKKLIEPESKEAPPKRVLVGDAGAIIYAADAPGIDLIGLGGFQDYPFARAHRHGVGASLELIERLPDDERPAYLALYPSWWGEMPSVFGRYIDEVPVVGNVICGGPTKVIYRADWSALERASFPRSMKQAEKVVGELDVADLVSEQRQRYERPLLAGRVEWRALPDPNHRSKDIFDAGRLIPAGALEAFEIPMPRDGGRLLVRTASTERATVRVLVDGREIGTVPIERADTWTEPGVDLPSGLPETARVELLAGDRAWVNYHVWTVASE